MLARRIRLSQRSYLRSSAYRYQMGRDVVCPCVFRRPARNVPAHRQSGLVRFYEWNRLSGAACPCGARPTGPGRFRRLHGLSPGEVSLDSRSMRTVRAARLQQRRLGAPRVRPLYRCPALAPVVFLDSTKADQDSRGENSVEIARRPV